MSTAPTASASAASPLLASGSALKEEGAALFKAGDVRQSISLWRKALLVIRPCVNMNAGLAQYKGGSSTTTMRISGFPLGIALVDAGGVVAIAKVTPDSNAARAGCVVGSRIIAVNGSSVTGLLAQAVTDRLKTVNRDEPVTLTVQSLGGAGDAAAVAPATAVSSSSLVAKEMTPAESALFKSLSAAIYNNLALAHLTSGSWESCHECALSVLELEPKNEKAIYRLAMAIASSGEGAGAIATLTRGKILKDEYRVEVQRRVAAAEREAAALDEAAELS